jgi:hypothetical protein
MGEFRSCCFLIKCRLGGQVESCQGDQIGRIFEPRVDVYSWHIFGKLQKKRQLLDYFFHSTRYALILTKHGLGFIWVNFSQTHLVTLKAALMGHFLFLGGRAIGDFSCPDSKPSLPNLNFFFTNLTFDRFWHFLSLVCISLLGLSRKMTIFCALSTSYIYE